MVLTLKFIPYSSPNNETVTNPMAVINGEKELKREKINKIKTKPSKEGRNVMYSKIAR